MAAIAVARNPESNAEALLAVCGEDESADRLIALHSNANLEVLKKLADSRDELVKKHLLGNSMLDAETIHKLQDPKVFVHKLK